jgi:ComF family protein
MVRRGIQMAVGMIYPPRCLTCGDLVESDFGLCGECWRDTGFIGGTICDSCGIPLPGAGDTDRPACDDCLKAERPWEQGRAALLYRDNGRRLVLALKHGDRQEIAKPAALWMANALRSLSLPDSTLIAPIPLHWTRLIKRRYNQSALLAGQLASRTGKSWCPDLLQRIRRTAPMEGIGHDDRYRLLENAIAVHPKRRHRLIGRPVLLVDDVMTSGATLTAATHACLAAGSGPICVVTLARVVKDT